MEKKKSVFLGVKRLKGFSNSEKQCNKCGFVTFYLRVLYTHKYKCQGKLLGSLICCYCKRKFNFLSSFSQHKKTCVKRYLKKKTMLKRNLEKKDKSIKQKSSKNLNESCTIVCPTCMNIFPSKHLYNAHMKKGPCAPKSSIKKEHFSARKSLPNAHDGRCKGSKKRKESGALQPTDEFYSNVSLSWKMRIEKTNSSYSTPSTDDGYMCLWCKNMYPTKAILLRHLERNSQCAKAHRQNQRDSFLNMSFTARKTTHSIVARKSFPRPNNRTNSRFSFKDVGGSARKSLTNSAHKRFRKNRASSSQHSPVKSLNICPVCYHKFPDSFSFFKHQKKLGHWGKATKSTNSSCKCPFCEKGFFSVRARNAHLRNHADKSAEDIEYFLKSTTCNICSQIFVSEILKQQHIKIVHAKSLKASHDANSPGGFLRSYSSPRQEHWSYKHSLLPFVMKQKLKEYPNSCPVCSKDFSSSFFRNKHFQEKHLDSELECKFCPLKFNNVDKLENHMQDSHYDSFKFKCLACKINLATAPHVVLHVTLVHPDADPKSIIRCRINESSFSNQQKIAEKFNYNVQAHQGKNLEYFCDICNISFQKLCGLASHRQSKSHRDTLVKSLDEMHQSLSSLPPSPPPVMKKSVPQPEILVCSECSDEFTSIKDFVPHRLSHFSFQSKYMKINELNSYTCEICGDISDSHSKVQMHLFWHLQVESTSNEKNSLKIMKNDPIVPDRLSGQHVAKKSFSKSLESQQEVIIGGVKKALFTCEACKIGFTTQAHYSLHVRKFCKMKNSASPKSTASEEPEERDDILSQNTNTVSTTTAINKQQKLNDGVGLESNKISHCITCNSLFHSSLAETHDSFCTKCEQSSSTLDLDVDNLKSNMELQNILATCIACNSSFDNPSDFSKHMLTNHISSIDNEKVEKDGDDSKNIMHCTTCNCLFFSSDVLENHEIVCSNFSYSDFDTHSNKDILKAASELDTAVAICISCCLAFSDDQNLNEHISTHKDKSLESDDLDAKISSNGPYSFCEDDHAELNADSMPSNINNLTSASVASLSQDSSETEKLKTVEKSLNFCSLPNSDSSKTDPENSIYKLRENFSQLLCILIADQDLMHQLGYGEQPVDDVLSNVLQQMGQIPTLKNDEISDLDCLRKNIQMFLDFCLKDQIMELIGNGKTSTDDIVIEALKTFSNDDNIKTITSE